MSTPPPDVRAQIEAALQEALRVHQSGKSVEAERRYRHLLPYIPSHPGLHNYLGIALKDQARLDEAAAAFSRAIELSPSFAAAWSNLGNIQFEQRKRAEAEASYRRALALSADMPDALKNLGLVLVDDGRFEESFPYFRRHAELTYGVPRPPLTAPLAHKARHDAEQAAYVSGAASVTPGASAPFHLGSGDRIAGRAVRLPPVDSDVSREWATSSPQVVVIDDLLTPEALQALRLYCLRATVWQRAYPNGYIGAMPEHGFVPPLLAQIANEIREAWPMIVGDHPVLRWWGFKYDSTLSGINIHADFAAVNVNFWITPDEANLDPGSGGLVIWDKPAPLEWDFARYNQNSSQAGEDIRAFLEKSGARSRRVPHRANRAVIFDSDLFHETDRLDFRPGYENRRVNITLLYGRRGNAAREGG